MSDRYPEQPPHLWSIPADQRPAGTVLPGPAPADFEVRDLAAYLVIHDRGGIGYAGLDRDRAHEYAFNTGSVVVRLPVVGDYRPTADADVTEGQGT